MGFNADRLLIYIIVICSLFAAFSLYELIKRDIIIKRFVIKSIFAKFMVIIIVLSLFTFGILRLYPSPYILSSNWQITKGEINGMDWFLHKKDIGINQTYISIEIFRFVDLLLTDEEKQNRSDLIYYSEMPENLKLPYHFGYNDRANLGEYYTQDLYLILNQESRVVYQEVIPGMAKIRFQPQDFIKLETDKSVDRLYSSGGFDAYYIHGMALP